MNDFQGSLGTRLLAERVKADRDKARLHHYATTFVSKHIGVLDSALAESIAETVNNVEWLWSEAEKFVQQRFPRTIGKEERTKALELAVGNYHEIQTIVEYELQFIDFLSSMDSGDLARTNFQAMLRMHDDFLARENPPARMQEIWKLKQQVTVGYESVMTLAAHLFGSRAIVSEDVHSVVNSELEGVNIKFGYFEAAYEERRFKAARNNLANALAELEWLRGFLLFSQKHPELWDDINTLIDSFNNTIEAGG